MPSAEQINKILTGKFGDKILEFKPDAPDPYIKVEREFLGDIAAYLKTDKELLFDSLMCLTGIDYESYFEVVYNLYSMKHKHKITIKVECESEKPEVPSVSKVWKTANWHEREAYDLLGIVFKGHPDLRRLLLSDEWP
ncbi:MAG: NADH-quinone oxidoreductase subunit C, partial [Fidelibacterota bacterium]